MKPINLNQESCDPISSNCVIWQGPDIECIDLCKGDNVSQVIFKLSTELCKLMDMFNLSNYDLTCLNLGVCEPANFQELINIMIQNICDYDGPPETTATQSTELPKMRSLGIEGPCPEDCIIETAPIFYYTNPAGDLMKYMPIAEYVKTMGNKINATVTRIDVMKAAVVSHEERINALELAEPPVLELPKLVPTCTTEEAGCTLPVPLDTFAKNLELDFCELETAVGKSENIYDAMKAIGPGINNADRVIGLGTYADAPGWNLAPANLAESYNNLLIITRDLLTAVTEIQHTCCKSGCDAIQIEAHGVIQQSVVLKVTFIGTAPAAYTDMPGGSTIEITDSAGGTQIVHNVQIIGQHLNATEFSVALAGTINPALDLSLKILERFENITENSVCELFLQIGVLGTSTCPRLGTSSGETTITGTYNWAGPLATSIKAELLSDIGVSLQIQTIHMTVQSNDFTFSGLIPGTTYQVRLIIGSNNCEIQTVNTRTLTCNPPVVGRSNYNLALDPQGLVTGTTIEQWLIDYNNAH